MRLHEVLSNHRGQAEKYDKYCQSIDYSNCPSLGRDRGALLHEKIGRMTLREVARRAGVSTATVSRVLNETAVVKGSTRSRVLKAAKEL
jgi:ribosomal protein S14